MSDTTSQTASSAGRVIAVVAGTVTTLIAIAFLAVAGAVLWADGRKDADGYITTGTERLQTTTYALASENLEIDGDLPSWVQTQDVYGTVRLSASSQEGKPVFVGIARTRDVDAYLGRSAHSVVTDFSTSPFSAAYSYRSGVERPARPATQPFWAASATGTGTQEVTWDVKDGDWSVVVMNADGSRGVDAGVRLGADVPLLTTIGWTALGGGLLLLTAAGGLLYIGLRTPRPRRGDTGTAGLVPAAGG